MEGGTSPDSIIYVDFELPSNSSLTDPNAFIAHVAERANREGHTYLFVDEVQELDRWEPTINGLRAEIGLDIYVTGSATKPPPRLSRRPSGQAATG